MLCCGLLVCVLDVWLLCFVFWVAVVGVWSRVVGFLCLVFGDYFLVLVICFWSVVFGVCCFCFVPLFCPACVFGV